MLQWNCHCLPLAFPAETHQSFEASQCCDSNTCLQHQRFKIYHIVTNDQIRLKCIPRKYWSRKSSLGLKPGSCSNMRGLYQLDYVRLHDSTLHKRYTTTSTSQWQLAVTASQEGVLLQACTTSYPATHARWETFKSCWPRMRPFILCMPAGWPQANRHKYCDEDHIVVKDA